MKTTTTITTQPQLRAAFWADAPLTTRLAFRQGKRQNDYNATIRMAWCDFVEMMQRDGQISETLAGRATL